jgi:hypothetical protein
MKAMWFADASVHIRDWDVLGAGHGHLIKTKTKTPSIDHQEKCIVDLFTM